MIDLFKGAPLNKSRDGDFQAMTIRTVAAVAAATSILFSVINYWHGHFWLAITETIAASLFVICFFAKFKEGYCTSKNLLMFVSTALILALFLDGGVANSGMIWSLLLPFLANLLFGLPRSWYWIVASVFIFIVALLVHLFLIKILPYSDVVLLYFLAIYLIFTLLAAAFELQFERSYTRYQVAISELEDLKENLEINIKNRTEALYKSNNRLKHEVKLHRKTSQALQESESRMHQVQKMEAIDTLVGGIAHDFNNMLAGINANMFMIKQKVVDEPDLLRRVKDVEKLVMNASDMIRQLLTFARKDHIELESFDIAKLLKSSFKLAEVAVPKKIQINFDNQVEQIVVEGNKTQVQQVLMNMINNARDAVKGVHKPKVLVQLREHEATQPFEIQKKTLPSGKYVVLTIRDNGEGIPQDKIEKVFEPFFTTKEVGKGTGLGLAMCFGAVQSHGGAIRVRSKVGLGTIFEVFIPVAGKTEIKPITQEVTQERLKSGETILLVDDDDQLRESQKDALESIGYQVITAKNGKEAIEVYKEIGGSIDLIISDLTMPVMGGVRAAKEIRKIEPDVKIMFITGYDRDSTFNGEGVPNVGEVVLEKPYTMFQLHDVIQKQLQA